MIQGRNNITDLFSDLDDIELSLEEHEISETDKISESKSVVKDTQISPFSIYLSEIGKHSRIDHETEFWYGVIITTGRILDECPDLSDDQSNNKQLLLKFLIERILRDVKTIEGICLPENMIHLDVAMLFSEAVIIRMEDFFDKSSYLLNLINENNLFKNEEWEKVAFYAVEILACLNALPLDLFSSLSFRFYQSRNRSEVPSIKNLLSKYQLEHWDLDEVYARLEKARENLCISNLRLVIKFAKKFNGRGVPFPDLVQEGNIGLLEAVERYDPSRGHKFSTYAYHRIRHSLQRAVFDKSRLVRIPVHAYEAYYLVCKIENELQQNLGRLPNDSEIAELIDDFTESKIRKLKLLFNHEPSSLDETIGQDSGSTLLDISHDTSVIDPLDLVEMKDFRERVLCKVDDLFDERHKYIFLARFGFLDGKVHTLQQVADDVGLTRERIRQIQVKIIRILRHPSKRKLFS